MRLLEPWTHRYSLVSNEIIDRLLALFKQKNRLEKNLVIWYHSGDTYSTWILQFIRFVQLKLLQNAKTTFVLCIYVDRHSPLLPGLKTKEALPTGDLWAFGDELVRICSLGSGSEALVRAFGDSRRIYVISDESSEGGDLSRSILGSISLPNPKFEEDMKNLTA